MREIIQLIVSFTGSLGFAALFNIHGKKLWFAALGGCLSWAVYLAVEFVTPSPYVCGFWSTVAITLYAECMARVHKTPVTVFLGMSMPLGRRETPICSAWTAWAMLAIWPAGQSPVPGFMIQAAL